MLRDDMKLYDMKKYENAGINQRNPCWMMMEDSSFHSISEC